MKILNQFFIVSTVVMAIFFTSCSSKKIGFFNNSYPQYAHKDAPIDNAEASVHEAVTPIIAKNPVFDEFTKTEQATIVRREGTVRKSKNTLPIKAESTIEKTPLKKVTKQERKEIKQAIKKESTSRAGINTLLLVIIAILLPPLAVLFVDGLMGPFWLDLLLTILFYFPGLIYALWRVFRGEQQ